MQPYRLALDAPRCRSQRPRASAAAARGSASPAGLLQPGSSGQFDRRFSGARGNTPSALLPEAAATLCSRAVEFGHEYADLQARAELLEEGTSASAREHCCQRERAR
jgi:hypothetical protein